MSKPTHHDQGWEVLAQATGEVLTAEARSPGLVLGLLGVPQGFEARDAEGWLYDVAGVSHEASAGRPARRPIPAILEHAITGLLFSHGELWEHPGCAVPCSFAFIEGRGEIGFGWVGEARVSVWVDGEPRDAGFITLRDSRGRKGKAWSIPSYHNVQVRISWLSYGDDPAAGGAEVEASWIADGRTAPGYHPVPIHNEHAAVSQAAPVEPEPEAVLAVSEPAEAAPAEALPEPIPLHPEAIAPAEEAKPRAKRGFGAWLQRTFGWLRFGREEAEDEVNEDEVWRVAAEETVDLVATGTDDAVGFNTGVVPAGPTLQLAGQPPSDLAAGPADRVPGDDARTWERASEPIGYESAPQEFAPAASADGSMDAYEEPVEYPPAFDAEPALDGPEWAEPLEEVAAGPVEEWTPTEDPHSIELPSLEPAARLARIEESLRESERGLELVGVTPDEPEAAAPPAPVRIAEGFPDEYGGLEVIRTGTDDVIEVIPAGAPEPVLEAVPLAEEAAEAVTSEAAADEALPPSWTAIAPQRPAWPTAQELERSRGPRLGRAAWIWAAIVLVLFAGGWLVGGIQEDGHPRDAARRGALGNILRAVGLGGPRYRVVVTSRPPGAAIAVDGTPLTAHTPAEIEATPGPHVIGLSFPDHGSANFKVNGRKGERVPLEASLWGALDITSPDEIGVIGVSVDGVPRGLAPLRADSLAPGVHEVRFSAPGLEPWGQTVEIQVGETKELLSRAVQAPSTGVLEVQASITDESGSQPLKGAQVFVDGESRGVTPLVLDLPRGPHSVRLNYKGQDAPIQVIDLPGGNQRFAVFEMGLDNDNPRLNVDLAARIPRDRPAIISATVEGVAPGEVREMWLHVQMPEGAWRRYAMTMLKASGGAAGVVTFPTAAFDARGRARYYVSAQSGQGDETFTEVRTVTMDSGPAH